MSTPASSVLMDDDRVRVTRYDFAPGDETGWHVHDMEYVIVTLTDCRLRLDLPGGSLKVYVQVFYFQYFGHNRPPKIHIFTT